MSTHFEIRNGRGTSLDECGEMCQGSGARFNSLEEAEAWNQEMIKAGGNSQFEFKSFVDTEHDGLVETDGHAEWFNIFSITATEYENVGFGTYYWRRCWRGWAVWTKDGWELVEINQGEAK